ncbi:lipase family protein [Priestia koreensis]|uniref:lipase family protein n=1 Tax=Priestia koreensis TaxID=284581 RepID=UPI00204247E9|nr:lipase family protein [Priestia koreensis]MCM3006025.1 lipase family protein [Priestia koreensis]
MFRTPYYNKSLALFLLNMCELAYTQYQQNGLVSVPEGFTLVTEFQATTYGKTGLFGFILESEESVIVAFRGTQSDVDWMADADYSQSYYPYTVNGGLVHNGFLSVYESCRDFLLDVYKKLSPNKTLYITGHSLGAALATLHAADVATNQLFRNVVMYNFASPRVGDPTFAARYHQLVPNSIRFVNTTDVVAKVPPIMIYGPKAKKAWYYCHVEYEVSFTVQGGSLKANHFLDTYKRGIKRLSNSVFK